MPALFRVRGPCSLNIAQPGRQSMRAGGLVLVVGRKAFLISDCADRGFRLATASPTTPEHRSHANRLAGLGTAV